MHARCINMAVYINYSNGNSTLSFDVSNLTLSTNMQNSSNYTLLVKPRLYTMDVPKVYYFIADISEESLDHVIDLRMRDVTTHG